MTSRDLERLMWADACEMLDRAERLRRQFFRPASGAATSVWEPPVDVYQSADTVWLVVAMPGVSPEAIEVSVRGSELVVSGERALPAVARAGSVRRLEIPHGRFERRLTLPPGTYRLAERYWEDGCLFLGLQIA
ncbi:Hsp20/alpha crystallin family protein [Spiribacter halobius]|nr:Hsp20/alpha crystallin family protein [Spiribacter halobius]UEX79827.1 Hsp20/alpha crystallin family protein [Spiribacter halobius]